ncbi:MAG: phosphoenolpyruvate--protein phosphotransferase [Endomicrobium sp.]|jgi:phosphotransferase system enzyme I (PtsI)|uniref:phosphoenolpyruvate--protein phosphotransferase n=1 Tax=Candidatus Endomicrobiellum cubanum TaxID=3242325 RepID=UPI00281E9196|nr:phosphoenolpyruvate--protein phosphotransferase [Endomicrobium sp.]
MFIDKDRTFKGIAASSGIAIGKAFLLMEESFCLIRKEIPQSFREAEKKRFDDAIDKTRTEFKDTYNKINNALGENYADIASVHILISDDPTLRKDVYKLIADGVNAEYALFKVLDKIARSFDDTKKDNFFKERKTDIQNVGKKILSNLFGKEEKKLSKLDEDSVIIAHNLTPADTISIRGNKISGFATDIGGKTSHTAIIAQGLAIPAVVGLKNISTLVKTGEVIIVDGDKGEVILNPSQETLLNYKKKYDLQLAQSKESRKLKDLKAETVDKHEVSIFANIDHPDEVQIILNNGAFGIGLYRTETIYFNRDSIPTEQEHFDMYSKVIQQISPYEAKIRTFDLGGDKLTKIGSLNLGAESNPFLGLRAMRLCLKYPEIFIGQLRAILRASVLGKVKLMYPMISGLDELRAANAILNKVKEDLRKENIKFDENIEVGAMIEVPSAVAVMDLIAKEVDFISIGTNDLIQYTLAVDRVNENVSYLYNPMHPAVLRFIKCIVDEGHKVGIKVSMCGEMAGEPKYTPIILGMGLDEFSVSPMQIIPVKDVIRNMSFADCKALANKVMKLEDSKLILKELDLFIRKKEV